jgi:predicted patatin/cPLA2 family phospholipase
MARDLIFVFFGGSMSGIFGAGAATALQELDLYDRIHSVYGISAGAHNAAYFLAEDTRLGSSIYYQDLINDAFIKKGRGLQFLSKLILRLVNNNVKLEKLINMDHLISVEKHQKKLNVEKISRSPINFYIRVFNVAEKKEEYLEGKSDIFKKLLAGSAVVPFYPDLIEINSRLYADSLILSRIIDNHLAKMIGANKDKKIFFIFNEKVKSRLTVKKFLFNLFWSILLMIYFKKTFIFKKINIFAEYRKLRKYCRLSNLTVIEPEIDFSPACTNQDKLLELYANGMAETKRVMKAAGLIPGS